MERGKRNEAGPVKAKINFHSEKITYRLEGKNFLRKFVQGLIIMESKECGEINFIFCNDQYLLELNSRYLKHNTYTDIITFEYSTNKAICGDIFISIDRIRENASKFTVSFLNELYRVMIHGVLHLLGYKDKRKNDQAMMRSKEDHYLDLLFKALKQ